MPTRSSCNLWLVSRPRSDLRRHIDLEEEPTGGAGGDGNPQDPPLERENYQRDSTLHNGGCRAPPRSPLPPDGEAENQYTAEGTPCNPALSRRSVMREENDASTPIPPAAMLCTSSGFLL
jgi:hypothetical protein